MKHTTCGRLATLIILGGLLAGCGAKKPELHLFTWADYFKPSLIAQFEQSHGCKVVVDTFDSNEAMLAKFKAGASGYDLVTPSSYAVAQMRQLDMLQPIDHAKIPNLGNVDPVYLKSSPDPRMEHSVPYMLTYTGVAYRKDRVKDVASSWSVFDRTDLKGRMTLFNDMRETLGAGLKSLGYSINTVNRKELEAARDVVIRWKKNIAKFENEQYKTGVASGEFLLVHGYSGDIVQVMGENSNIVFMLPREGFSMSCDDFVIPKNARNVALAHAFINFFHDADNAAANTEEIGYLCPNSASFPKLSEATRSNPAIFPPEEVRAKGEIIQDVGANLALYTEMWDGIKAAR